MFKRIKKIKKLAMTISMVFAAVKAVESYGKKVQDKNKQKQVVENSRILQAKKLREKFNLVNVGDLTDDGHGGSNESEILELFGEPDVITDSKIQDIDVKVYTWRRNMIILTIQLTSDHVISKNITGFRWGERPEKLTLEVFDNLETNSSYSSIIGLIDEPDGYNESRINDHSLITATWRTGLNGRRGANAILLFRDDQLIDKSQVHLA
ncbi:hypothetical protein J2Z60_001097 [Lactobacillus colini]|uniref:Uncharacterized protein n=1 Tax=Lactobacillus colini TaxID=1819254 RepID=A0ABS4ME14_9LACO|nr:DUF3862 domain-containing protein [Lactobacillus colini]MBP2057922.1 hypothetical protein [Lactobacillus colini]